MFRRAAPRLAVAVLLVSAVAGFAAPSWSAPELKVVKVSNFRFEPGDLTIKVGDTVRWQLTQGTHTVTSRDGLFDGDLAPGGPPFEHTFDVLNPGGYAYFCEIHGDAMSGVVKVVNVPAAPTDVVASASNRSATVSWRAPSDNGGAPITGYVIEVLQDGAVERSIPKEDPSETSLAIMDLTNRATYTFTVAAINAGGTGPASARSQPVTPTASAPPTTSSSTTTTTAPPPTTTTTAPSTTTTFRPPPPTTTTQPPSTSTTGGSTSTTAPKKGGKTTSTTGAPAKVAGKAAKAQSTTTTAPDPTTTSSLPDSSWIPSTSTTAGEATSTTTQKSFVASPDERGGKSGGSGKGVLALVAVIAVLAAGGGGYVWYHRSSRWLPA